MATESNEISNKQNTNGTDEISFEKNLKSVEEQKNEEKNININTD